MIRTLNVSIYVHTYQRWYQFRHWNLIKSWSLAWKIQIYRSPNRQIIKYLTVSFHHSLSFKVSNQNVNRKQAWYKQSNCFLNEGSVTFYCCLWLLSKSLNRSRGFCFGLFSILNNKITVASVKKLEHVAWRIALFQTGFPFHVCLYHCYPCVHFTCLMS